MKLNVIEITTVNSTDELIPLAPYCRVSSDSKDQLHSFAAQIKYYKDYERTHPQYKLVDIYADEGITGTEMDKRDELHRLFRDCEKGKIKRVIVKSVSRFARNTEELIIAIRRLKELGVSIYFEEQDIDTDKMPIEMIVTFPGIAAQQESEAISGNMRWSYKKRMESGEFNTTYPAYGYYLINNQLVINEAEAVVVRRIFAMYLQGIGKQRIANILNSEGVPRRDGKEKWYVFTVDYILNNERYMGDALLQKQYTTETLPFRRRKNNGELPMYYVENSNPPIVSREIFKAVQELQNSRRCNTNTSKGKYILSGIMRCPDCNRTFRRQTISNIAYWICSGKASGATDCNSRRVLEDEIYESFINMTIKLKDYRKSLLGVLIHQIELMQSKCGEAQERIKAIDKEIADLATQNLVITRLHSNGILNASEYSQQSSEIGNKISALRSERKKIVAEDENDLLLDELRQLDSAIDEYIPTMKFNQELFEQIVEGITIDSNSEITFKLIGGIELTEEINEKGRCKSA